MTIFMINVSGCRCAKLTQDKLDKGKIKRFSWSVNSAETAIVVPRKTAKNIHNVEELRKAFNTQFIPPQIQGAGAHEVDNDDQAEDVIEHDQQQLNDEAAGPQPQH